MLEAGRARPDAKAMRPDRRLRRSSLLVRVVAEGVEGLEHATTLRDLGCDVVQGYHFARPMAAGDVTALLLGTVAAGPLLAGSS